MYYLYYTFKNDEPDRGYVGMTSNPNGGKLNYKGSGLYLLNTFKKYGKENFTRTDLGEFENKDETHYWESFYIKLLKTQKKENGYNISPSGGMYASGFHSDETKRKLSEICKGKKRSAEFKRKVGDAHRGEKNYLFGKHLSIETREKLRISNLGKTPKNKGIPMTPEQVEKNRISHLGIKAGMTGKRHSEKTKNKISTSQKQRITLLKKDA